MQMQSTTAHLTTVQACEILGIDRATLTRWVKLGTVHAQKLPGRTGAFLYDRAEIERVATEKQATDGATA